MNPPSPGWVLEPIVPIPVIVLLAVVLVALTARIYWRVGQSIGAARNLTLLLLRLAGIALVLLLLLQPSEHTALPPPTRDRITLIGLDTSLSMKQTDAGNVSRFDAAKKLLQDAGAIAPNGLAASSKTWLFGFAEDAHPVLPSVLDLKPTGRTTLIDKSVNTMLAAPDADEAINALVLLTDGHDFEMINPVKTGLAARTRGAPIYAVALGRQGDVRDVAVRITSFQPYCYVKQKAHINASLRLIGCELEDLNVQLLRQGQVVQTKRVNAQQLQELPVEFEITEPATGQYEYEVQVQPLANEIDTTNNSAITYLNVIDQQIRVLVLEGDPYWDTTFLQRSLMQNDKVDVDALIRYGAGHVRAIRKTPVAGELQLPQTVDQLAAYDVVILGRSVETLADPGPANFEQLLDTYVKERGGTVIFARGEAFAKPATDLNPVKWSDQPREHVHLDATPEGRSLSVFQALNSSAGGMDALPDMIDAREPGETQPLTSILATVASRDNPIPQPAIVQRRYGAGQVVSIGVDGLWRWTFNAKITSVDSPFDRFWDQTILWLLAGRDFIPTKQFSFRPNSANVLLGDKVYFHLMLRKPDSELKSVPVTISYNDAEVGKTTLLPSPTSAARMSAEFLPERAGRYRATVALPDGSKQESRFIVFAQNLEETEVATDALYLSQLCEASGGRVIQPEELPKLLDELAGRTTDRAPKIVVRPVWNAAWVFYLVGLLFGLDWFLRRRWGLC